MPQVRPRALPLLSLLAAALASVLALAALPMASAQIGSPCTLVTSVNPATFQHQPGEARMYNFTVAAPGLGGQLQARVDQVSPGWNATLGPTSAQLNQGDNRTLQVLVTAPSSASARAAQVVVTATLTCVGLLPQVAAGSDTESQTLSPVLAPPPVAPSPANEGRGLLAGPSAGAALLLIVGGVVVLGAAIAGILFLRPRGLSMRAPEPRREMPPGGGASFPVTVTNRGGQKVVAAVRVAGLPDGWRLVSPPADLTLAPGESMTLQVLLRSPEMARPGETADVDVELLERGSGRLRKVSLAAHVTRVGDRIDRPDVVIRDGGR